MFGISFSEIAVIAVIALVVVGPHKLPGMLRTMGLWVRKIRKMTTEVRAQTGIDEILREEGIDGVHELRSLLRGEIAAAKGRRPVPADDPYLETLEFDLSREYPSEGPDAYHAVPDDLLDAGTSAKAPANGSDTQPETEPPAENSESVNDVAAANAPSAPPAFT
ncbi:MAG TPA: Sec-independent protein translocase protein TatB, partial [Polyangiaceae bacterium]|nr:Sec-independent protein translocase protein TatB [Polyangiaceae bacterium]